MFYQCSTVVHASSKTYPSPLSVEIPTQCPICSVAYNDIPLSIHQFERETFHTGHVFASAVYFCPHCENSFYVTYVLSSSDYPVVAHIYATYPTNEHKTEFPKSITDISPDFVEIYNQAEIAESNNLTEICGLGYRKALEFLIKDYAILTHPDEKSKIETQPISQCISNYISDSKISTLATAASWIGNDETHYIRKHPDYDIKSLKAFIKTMLAFIENEIAFQEAQDLLSNNGR